MLSLEQGIKLVRLAREAIELALSKKKPRVSDKIKKEFSEERGVFVTLHKKGDLRGCIGYPEPVYPLYEAVIKAAANAAFGDPRFPQLEKNELNDVNIEVSVLTIPELIYVRNPSDYTKQIKVGKDGLIVKGTFGSGLLLPQVAIDFKWDALTFLSQTCIKAGLPPDSYHDYDKCRVYKFQGQVFTEQLPNGEVIQSI